MKPDLLKVKGHLDYYHTHTCTRLAVILFLVMCGVLVCLSTCFSIIPITCIVSMLYVMYHGLNFCRIAALKTHPQSIQSLQLDSMGQFWIETLSQTRHPVKLIHAWIGSYGFWACFQAGTHIFIVMSCDDLPSNKIRCHFNLNGS
ncbi:MAG: hypothetical protein CMF51_03060 [Legionellales bacterium]|nr:hypothetical protein [Legionellales bacterium]